MNADHADFISSSVSDIISITVSYGNFNVLIRKSHADTAHFSLAIFGVNTRRARRLRHAITLQNFHAGMLFEALEQLHAQGSSATDEVAEGGNISTAHGHVQEHGKHGGHTGKKDRLEGLRALEESEECGAFSALAMSITGVMTALLLPFIVTWLR